MIDIVGAILFFAATFSIFLYLFKRQPRPAHDIIVTWLFNSCYSWVVYRLALQYDWYGYVSPTLTDLGSVLVANLVVFPLVSQIYLMLLRGNWLTDLAVTVAVSSMMTGIEFMAVKYTAILVYGARWHFGFTFLTYFLSYVTIEEFSRYWRSFSSHIIRQ